MATRRTTANRIERSRWRATVAVLASTLLLTACAEATPEPGASDADAGTPGSGEAVVAGSAELSTEAIPFRDLYDFRSGDDPVVRTEAVQLDACPLLSLDTLVASTRSYSEPTVLTSATSQRCTFASGAAFTFLVEVEAAADVDVDNHDGRAYNMDVEPIVEPQSGPGTNAVTLVDTAFADLSDSEGFRYLYFFVLGEQALTLRSTALEVNDDGWRVLADEVAENIRRGAAGGEVETTEVVDDTEAYTIEQCGFVTTDQLAALTGLDPADITTNHDPNNFRCRWEHPDQLGMSIRFGAAERTYADEVSNASGEDRQGDLGILAVGTPVTFSVWLLEDDPRGFSVNADSEAWFAAADAVAVNLVQRIEKPAPL
jgi:hypothetical protein